MNNRNIFKLIISLCLLSCKTDNTKSVLDANTSSIEKIDTSRTKTETKNNEPLKSESIKDTIFYNADWEETSKANAVFYRPLNFEQIGNLWEVKDYYITGELQYTAYSLSKISEKWHGKAIWYNKDGSVSQETQYYKGLLDTPENRNRILQEKLYEIYDIERVNDETLISKTEGFISNDTIPDVAFLFNGNYSNKRLVIQIKDEDGDLYNNDLRLEEPSFLDSLSIKDYRLQLHCKDERRISEWQRTLNFILEYPEEREENQSSNSEDYDEYYEGYEDTGMLLEQDIGRSYYVNQHGNTHRKSQVDFGDVYLSNFKFTDSSDHFTWYHLQKDTDFQDYKYPEDTLGYEAMIDFLGDIEDSTTVYIKKGVYNFSKLYYERTIPIVDDYRIYYDKDVKREKVIQVSDGQLHLDGFKYLKLIAEEGTYFITNEIDAAVILITDCKDITISNIFAVHNIYETNCWGPVFAMASSEYVTFDNCTADGSGQIGFDLYDDNKNITIKNSTIQHCNAYALNSFKSDVTLDNITIQDNKLSSSIVHLVNSKCSIKNSLISNNYRGFQIQESVCIIDSTTITPHKDGALPYLFYTDENNSKVILKNCDITLHENTELSDHPIELINTTTNK